MSPIRESLDVLHLFQRAVPGWFLRDLCGKHGYGFRQGIYNAGVVIWLMIWQRLQGNRSQQAAVQHLLQGGAGEMQIDCKRWNEDRVSSSTGSYSAARQRLPAPIVREVTERVIAQLRAGMEEGWEGLQRPVFVVDGTTVQLQHEPDLVSAYSPGRNQHGENHWPVLQILVMHDVYSGLALAPGWGPMYGDAAVSEQALAAAALNKLPPDAVVLGDANFGVFAFAYAVHQSGRPMILRLSRPRARNLLGEDLKEGTVREIVWRPSRWDRKSHPQLPEHASVEGRVLACPHPSCPGELLYLFTILELPAEQILGIYRLRWRVETDLRTLKRTVGLHQLSSKSPDMVEKELLLAVAAYNLIRAVMCLAARRANIEPRQLVFRSSSLWWKRPCRAWTVLPAKRNTSSGWNECCALPHRVNSLAEPATVRIRVRSGDVAQSSPLERKMPKARERQNKSPRPSVGSRPVLASGKRKLSSQNLGPRPEVPPARHHLPLLQRSRRHLRPPA